MSADVRRVILSGLVFVATLVLAVSSQAGESLAQLQEELDLNRARWALNGDDDYTYRMERQCFCFPEFVTPGIVKVRGGEIAEVTPVDEFGSLDSTYYLTVEGLFTEIQNAIDQKADSIAVTWEPDLGYPTVIDIDYVFPAVDDEVRYLANDLVLGTGYEEDQAELDTAQAIWNASEIVHYRFRLQQSCFCPPEIVAPGEVEVLDDVIVSVVDPETGDPLDPENYKTVAGLFAVVQGAIDFEAFSLVAEYDPGLGYPTGIHIDAAEFLADDTVSYTASELVDLPEPGALPLQLTALIAIQSLFVRRRSRSPYTPGVAT